MDFSFTEEQEAVRELAARIFSDLATHERLREVEASDERIDRKLWAELASAGLLGIDLPESVGGAALGFVAAGIVAGHIIECGAQCSGGNCLYDWRSIPDLGDVGYPIVEASADGSFVVTKHPKTGGIVSVQSVSEQLVYEMGDPKSYITPDVIADFTSIHLAPDGTNRVRVHGITGRPPTDKLKVSIAYRAGFKAVGTLVYSWPDALDKARLADRVLRERLDRLGLRFEKVLTEYVGADATHGPLAGTPSRDLAEVQLRVGVRGTSRQDIERFTRELAPLVLNGPPSVTGFAGGRPKVEEVVAYWPALIDKQVVRTEVDIL